MLERTEAKTKDGLERIANIVRYGDEYKVETSEKKGRRVTEERNWRQENRTTEENS